MAALNLIHDHAGSLHVTTGDTDLLRYVYLPTEAQLESPRPYFHPLRTLSGRTVSLYRPHDHVWHKGIAWSLPNIDTENFWGGTTYLKDTGYQQLDNNGSMRHRDFHRMETTPDTIQVGQHLDWVTQDRQHWFTEDRHFGITINPDHWTLTWSSTLTNISGRQLSIGSPTTNGRPNAGYGGLFWRGPRSFTGGTVDAPTGPGGDELMGTRGEWMGYRGTFDGDGESATLVFVDDPANFCGVEGQSTRWFVRTAPFACVCPAPFFDVETALDDRQAATWRYAVSIADGDAGHSGSRRIAESTLDTLRAWEIS